MALNPRRAWRFQGADEIGGHRAGAGVDRQGGFDGVAFAGRQFSRPIHERQRLLASARNIENANPAVKEGGHGGLVGAVQGGWATAEEEEEDEEDEEGEEDEDEDEDEEEEEEKKM